MRLWTLCDDQTAAAYTENVQYAINFYLSYFSRWPDMCAVQETPQGRIMGYGACLAIPLFVYFHPSPPPHRFFAPKPTHLIPSSRQ